MQIVYWVVLVVSASFTGMKGAQVQQYYKKRRALHRDQRQQAFGSAVAFVCGVALMIWALCNIWIK